MPVPTLFSLKRDDKRTVYVNWQDQDKLLEIWKDIRQAAGEPIDNPPQIIERKPVDFNLLGESRFHNGVTYWVTENGIADDPAGRQNEIHAPRLDSAFRHSRKAG
jgi:hypothetical protein